MFSRTSTVVMLAIIVRATIAAATPIVVPVDQTQSNLDVEFCLNGNCDIDTSPVSGTISIKLDDVVAPSAIAVYDFDFALLQPINLSVPDVVATGENITTAYATPAIPLPSQALGVGGTFSYAAVPTTSTGTLSYTVTGLTCFALMLSGPPCSAVIDLSTQPPGNASLDGTVESLAGRTARVVLQTYESGPIDPAVPSLGTMTTSGTVVAEVQVPLRGDADLDGTVDGQDVQAFTDVLLNPAAYGWQERFAVDMNDDDAFDLADTAAFVDCLINDNCLN